MKKRFACLVLALGFATVVAAEEKKVAGVKLGAGAMTFETVPGWGLDEKGKSVLGSTHGGVAVGKDGTIYTSSSLGLFAFSPEGKVVNRFLGDKYSNMHDIKINQEGDAEFIYAARNQNAEGIKINAKNGDIVLKLTFPEESGLKLTNKQMSPTAITVADNGDIFLSNGYATNHIFKFDKTGKYLKHFGTKGNGLKEFNTAHGMCLDTRYTPNRLLVCDRNHTPNGRLVHYSLDGEFIAEVITGLGMPTSAIVQGDYVAIPDLKGWLTIIGKDNKIVAELGRNPDPKKGASFGIPQDQWVEGAFSGTHGSAWDKDGNLYVQDWNVSGRIMKLVKVKS